MGEKLIVIDQEMGKLKMAYINIKHGHKSRKVVIQTLRRRDVMKHYLNHQADLSIVRNN